MSIFDLLSSRPLHRVSLAAGFVAPDPYRCVQCGICSYNCPIGIDVRAHAWKGKPVKHRECLTCGECVARCPRGALRFEKTAGGGGS